MTQTRQFTSEFSGPRFERLGLRDFRKRHYNLLFQWTKIAEAVKDRLAPCARRNRGDIPVL